MRKQNIYLVCLFGKNLYFSHMEIGLEFVVIWLLSTSSMEKYLIKQMFMLSESSCLN